MAEQAHDDHVDEVCGERVLAEVGEEREPAAVAVAALDEACVDGEGEACGEEEIRGAAGPLAHGPEVRGVPWGEEWRCGECAAVGEAGEGVSACHGGDACGEEESDATGDGASHDIECEGAGDDWQCPC